MTTKTLTVTLPEFIAAMEGKGSKFARLFTVTRPKLNKTNRDTKERCPFVQGVERRAFRAIQIGCHYLNSVQNQREREGNSTEFIPQPLWNGKGLPDTLYTVKHADTGKRYLTGKPANDAETGIPLPPLADEWRDIATGKVIPFESVKPYLPPVSEQPATQETEKMVPWRTIAIDSIVSVQCGELYFLKHE